MSDPTQVEARLRRSLSGLRREVTDLFDATRLADDKDSFESTLRSAMDRIRKILGLG